VPNSHHTKTIHFWPGKTLLRIICDRRLEIHNAISRKISTSMRQYRSLPLSLNEPCFLIVWISTAYIATFLCWVHMGSPLARKYILTNRNLSKKVFFSIQWNSKVCHSRNLEQNPTPVSLLSAPLASFNIMATCDYSITFFKPVGTCCSSL
jgi:hypothetical protein